jgi:large subunit ribosomal protein L10
LLKTDKERIVAELADRLAATETLIVADYRGLTNKELEALRARLTQHGARLTVVKNTLTRRAAESAGADAVLALLEGPTAIAFVEADGDPAAVAKAFADTARDTKVLSIRGGVLAGSPVSSDQVDELAKLPPMEVLRGQVVAVIVAPLTQLAALLAAPLRDLVGLIDARIEQLGGEDAPAAEEPAEEQPAADEAAAAEERAEEAPSAEVGEAESQAGDDGEEPAEAAGTVEADETAETPETDETAETRETEEE